MQRTVIFLAWTPKRNFYDEKLECSLRFSVVNSSLLGTAREHESIHTLKVVMSDILLVNWGLPEAADPSAISENMVKLALQSAEDYIAGQLKKGPLEENLPSLSMRPDNSPDSCPLSVLSPTRDRMPSSGGGHAGPALADWPGRHKAGATPTAT